MLDLEARFSPRIIPASTEYPYGELKPNTSTGSNDGTPVTAALGNDLEGFKQAAITRANIDPSGSPDTAVNSQLLNALDKRYLGIDYQTWTFATGGLLTDCSQAVKHTDGNYYSWSGVFPEGGKVVTAGTNPAAIGSGYVPRTDVVLLAEIVEITPSVFEALRRSYAEAGLTLVDGSFEEGGTLASTTDVLLYKANGKAYSGQIGTISAGTNPAGGGFTDRSGEILRDQLISDSASEGLSLIPTVSTDESMSELGVRIDDSREKLDESFTRGTNPSVFGTFKAPVELGIRTGQLVYYTKPGGAGLVTDLSRFFPAGYNLGPGSAEAAGLKAYYVSQAGSDANDGLSWATPLASIATAANKADADVVFIRAGRWTISNGITGKILTRDLVICCPEGRAFLSNQRDTTWTDNGDGTYTSAGLGGTPIRVADLRYVDDFGDPIWFAKLTTLAEVQATPYSWAVTAGSGIPQVVTVNNPSGAPTNSSTLVLRSASVQIDFNAQPFKFYAKNITFFGGDSAGMTPKNGVDSSVYASENCSYLSPHNNDCLRVQGVGLTISIRCKASNGSKDGFNYHAATNTASAFIQSHFIEIDCISHNNKTTMGTSNGSTAHEASVGFRIGGVYGYGVGPGVADINDTKTFNVSCTSNGGYGDQNAKGFLPANNCQMWLHNCTAAENRTAGFAAQDSATLFVRGSYADKYAITGSATISKF